MFSSVVYMQECNKIEACKIRCKVMELRPFAVRWDGCKRCLAAFQWQREHDKYTGEQNAGTLI